MYTYLRVSPPYVLRQIIMGYLLSWTLVFYFIFFAIVDSFVLTHTDDPTIYQDSADNGCDHSFYYQRLLVSSPILIDVFGGVVILA